MYILRYETWSFKCYIIRAEKGQTPIQIGIKLTKCPERVVSGTLLVAVEEAGWHSNGFPLNVMTEGGSTAMFAFDDSMVDSLQSLTLTIAIWFESKGRTEMESGLPEYRIARNVEFGILSY